MSLRSTFRSWIDRLMGTTEEEAAQTATAAAGSTTSIASSLKIEMVQWLRLSSRLPVQSTIHTSSHQQHQRVTAEPTSSKTSPSGASLTTKSSLQKLKKTRSKTPPKKKKEKTPNVLRSSVVDPENQIIPPLPRLSIREDTAEKLGRIMTKFDSMDADDLTPPSKRKND